MSPRRLPAAVLVLLAGCAGGGATTGTADAGALRDAGIAGSSSSTAAFDAGTADASAPVVDAAVPVDAGVRETDAAVPDAAAAHDAGRPGPVVDGGIGQRCFAAVYDPTLLSPDYDQYNPAVGSHCKGTNHQDITGVERVVFLGDSVTVGTPPTPSSQFYRNRLADQLATKFALAPPDAAWRGANPLNGQSYTRTSGAFANCAKWGARADDLIRDSHQVEDCIPPEERGKRTLVVMTIGGNDVASFTKSGAHAPYADTFAQVQHFAELVRETALWFREPGRFPNGVFLVFANMYEYTDGTGDLSSCPAASVAGFTAPWDHPEDLTRLMVWANEQFMQVAVETGTDMVFMLEHFCGHGYRSDDPSARCYRGPGTPRWFDLSCIHPNPEGHQQIADLMMAVVNE